MQESAERTSLLDTVKQMGEALAQLGGPPAAANEKESAFQVKGVEQTQDGHIQLPPGVSEFALL